MKIERWHALLRWLMPMVVTTILFGTIYVVAQQLDRSQANDAPLRLATQVAAELREGQSATINAQPHVDLSRSQAPFVVVENSQGVATAGSGYLRGALVSLPTGVLSTAAKNGHDDVTWQPAPGLRFATVTLKVDNQFVTAGQSLAPSEDRLGNLQLLIGFGWLASVLVIGGCWFWLSRVTLQVRRRFDEQSRALHSSE
ncbi:MAG TPA: hypothetical protein VHZ81_08265 [Galbitalea sp.]|jgi:hypothetical protein|nr:hypothetical protein [Galbitalea sp.]